MGTYSKDYATDYYQGYEVPIIGGGGGGGGGGGSGVDPINLVLDLDASDGSQITETGGIVEEWSDGTTSFTSPGGVRPSLISAAQNGLDVVRANGTTEYLSAATIPWSGTDPHHIFAVLKTNAAAGAVSSGPIGCTTSPFIGHYSYSNDALYTSLGKDTRLGPYTQNPAAVIRTWHIMESVCDGVTGYLYIDGTLQGSGAAGAGWNSGMFLFRHGGSYWGGDIGQIAGYDAVKGASAAADIRSYLTTKWGL